MANKKFILLFGMIMILSAMAMAEENFIFRQSEPFTLSISMANADLTPCTNCSCILSLFYPNGTALAQNSNGSNINGSCVYTTLSNTLGTHGGELYFNDSVDSGRATFQFLITATGNTLSTGKSISYILIFIVSFLIFLGLLIIGISLPSKNQTDELTGYVLAVSNLKYFKMLCLAFAYLVAMFISYFSWMMSYSYLDMDFMSNIFKFLFYGLAIGSFVFFPVGCYLVISNWVRDSKIEDMLSRGLRVR